MAKGHPQDGRSQISEGVRATAYGLRVHDPVCGPDVLVDEGDEGGLLQLSAALGTEDDGERLDVDEERLA